IVREDSMRALMIAVLILSPSAPPEFTAAPDGKPGNAGTPEAPWDLESALSGSHKIEAGSTIWVRGGTYKGKFQIRLAGAERAPIQVRAAAGERVTILNSGLDILEPSTFL